MSALKNLASKGYLLVDDQQGVESIIASCGENKQCVQNALFGNPNTLKMVFGLTVGSCVDDRSPVCNPQRVVDIHGQMAVTDQQREVLKQLWPGYEQMILASPEYAYKLEDLVVGKQMAQFLDVFHEVKQSKLPSADTEKLVGLMSQSIFQLSLQSVNQSATVGTIVGMEDSAAGKKLNTGSSPDISLLRSRRWSQKKFQKQCPT